VLDFFNAKMIGTSGGERNVFENTKRVALSIVWILYSFILIGIGINWKRAYARIFGVILIGITVLKVFLYDTAELNNFYRFVSWISLGIILLLIGFLYNKYKDRILQFISVKPSEPTQ
jgi:uncharacterized membrane protein